MTEREKREARDRHAELIHRAVDELHGLDGFRRWVEAAALNPQLTPLNAALVALQSPGEVVATLPQWAKQGARVPKGTHGTGKLTGRGFWPLTYFTAAQAGALELEDFDPELPGDDVLEPLRRRLVIALNSGQKARLALEEISEQLQDAPVLAAAA